MESATIRRVVHVVPALFGSAEGVVGGAERYAFELAQHMAAEIPTSLVTFGQKDREETVGPLRVRVLGRPHYVRGQRANPFACRLLKELGSASVVHCHQQHILASSLSALFCRLTGKRVFVTDMGGGGWDLSGYVSTDRWFHAHLHLSEYSRRVYGQAGKPWAHVILGGVNTERFSPAPANPYTGPVLYVGRLLPHKGVDYLIEAVPKDMPLEIIGQPYDSGFRERLGTLAAGKQVSFRHDCDDASLVEAYRQARCVVLPSVYRTSDGQETKVPELLGQTLLEGMACGLPGIGTAVASLPELIQDGITGFIVPPNDPPALGERLRQFRDQPELARRLGQAARRHVLGTFAWPNVVTRCLGVYRGAGAEAVHPR